MIAYLIAFLSATLSATFAHIFYPKSKLVFIFFSLITIMIPSLLAGLRSETVGTDMNFYLLEIYDKATIYSDKSQIMIDPTFEPVFLGIVFCALTWFKSLEGILFLLEFVDMTLVYTGIYLLRKRLHMGVAVAIYLLLFFNDSLNLMRQHVAVSLCFLSFAFLYRKKYIGCGLAFFFALFSHSTSFIFAVPILAFELLRRKIVNLNSNVMKTYLIGLPCSLFLIDPLLNLLMSLGVVSEKYSRYLTTENEAGTRFPLSFVFFFTIFFVLGIYVSNLIPKTWSKKNLISISKIGDTTLFLKRFFLFDIYSVIVVGMATLVSIWIYRMNIYFQVLLVGLIPMIFYRLDKEDSKKIKVVFFFLLFLYWYWTFIHSNNGETYPYHSNILGI